MKESKFTEPQITFSINSIKLLPIFSNSEENNHFVSIKACADFLQVYNSAYYKKIGFELPWIGYFIADDHEQLIGFGGFKGKPKNGKVEIAYACFPKYESKGVGSAICARLIMIAQNTDSNVLITAKTLPNYSKSTKILQKNNFTMTGSLVDEEDGVVWEWQLLK
jgi:[ribosomal protein S5]-alanine N-acetyltransferase